MAKTTRLERLEQCGTEIWRVDPLTSALCVTPQRCKLPECPACQELKRERTFKDLAQASKDLGGLVWGAEVSLSLVEGPYLRIPQTDGSAIVFCQPQNNAGLNDKLQECDFDMLWKFDLALHVPGKRRSGALINYRQKKRQKELLDSGCALSVRRSSVIVMGERERARIRFQQARAEVLEEWKGRGTLLIDESNVQKLIGLIETKYMQLLTLDQIDFELLSRKHSTLIDIREIKWNAEEIISIYKTQYRDVFKEKLRKREKEWSIERFLTH